MARVATGKQGLDRDKDRDGLFRPQALHALDDSGFTGAPLLRRPVSVGMDPQELLGQLFRPSRSLPVVVQAQRGECALACIVMIARYHGLGIDMTWLRNVQPGAEQGLDLKGLLALADSVHLEGRGIKLELDDLPVLTLPAILHWDMDHFVVLKRVTRDAIVIHDPAVGERRYRMAEAAMHITGVAIELWPGSAFRRNRLVKPPRLQDLVVTDAALVLQAGGILLLTLVIQCIALLNPYYIQLAVDQGLVGGNPALIPWLALFFFMLSLLKTLLVYLRGTVLMGFSHRLGFQLVSSVFRHLVSLPLGWFETRSMGEISSRFAALESVRRLLTQDMIAAVVDGLFSLVTLALLYVYSPLLATVATALILLFAAVRYLSTAREKSYRNNVLVEDARQKSAFLENIQAMTTLKVYGVAADRSHQWLNGYADYVNSAVQLDRFQNRALAWQNLILGIEHVATLYIGTGLVLQQTLSVGQLMAYVFLKQHFINAISSLLPRLLELRLIRLELERLSDITTAHSDVVPRSLPMAASGSGAIVTVEGLGFTYPGSSKPVLHNLDFSVPEGGCLLITGPSGCGKSTLLKLLLGLLQPQHGSIQVNGILPGAAGASTDTSDVAAVLHSDRLLSGSLLYNITLDRGTPDRQWLQRCIELASLRDDLQGFPDGLAMRLSESGAGLSAGQRQRVLLARALYGRPRLLILDEALTHLDTPLALLVVRRIQQLGIALILVTHNAELQACAEQRLVLRQSGAGQVS